MRRIEVFMGLLFIQNKNKNQYFINIMTCIFLSDGQGKEKQPVNLFNARTSLKWLPYTPDLAKNVGHSNSVKFVNARWRYV